MTPFQKELHEFIQKQKALNENITPKEMRQLLETHFGDFESPFWDSLDFRFAHSLDQEFFGLGGSYWLQAYGCPEEGHNGAESVGIFTFDNSCPIVGEICEDEEMTPFQKELREFIQKQKALNENITPKEMR